MMRKVTMRRQRTVQGRGRKYKPCDRQQLLSRSRWLTPLQPSLTFTKLNIIS